MSVLQIYTVLLHDLRSNYQNHVGQLASVISRCITSRRVVSRRMVFVAHAGRRVSDWLLRCVLRV